MSSYVTTFGIPTGNRFFPFSDDNDAIDECNMSRRSSSGQSYTPVVSITALDEQQQQEFGNPTWIVGSITKTASSSLSNNHDGDVDNNSSTTTTITESLHFLMVNDDGIISRINFDNSFENSTLLLDQQQQMYWPPTRPLLATTTTTMTTDPMPPNSTSILSLLTPFISPDSTSVYSSAIPITIDGDDNDDQPQQILFISEDQKLMYLDMEDGSTSSEVDDTIQDVLIDGNIVYSETNRMYAIYSGSTSSRYVHGVLGDREEGYKLNILLLDNKNDDDNNKNQIPIKLVSTIELPGDSLVYEGLNPMWTDIDDDGIDDLLTTIAQDGEGAALRVYFMNVDGTIRDEVSSEHIGVSGRWLHQLAVGPFGPNGEIEIVEIRTPHFDGHVRYYRYGNNNNNNLLENVADYSQFTSHDIGSRNLDRVIVGDFNGDGVPEVVVQNRAEECLFGLQRTDTMPTDGNGSSGQNQKKKRRSSNTEGYVEEIWRIDLPKPILSNIAISCTEQSGPQLLFSTADSSLLRIQFVPTTDEEVPEQTFNCSGASRRAHLTWKCDFAIHAILLLAMVCWRVAR